MKRDFLENLGLDKPTVDSVMAEYGKSVEAVKSAEAEKLKSAEETVRQLEEKLNGLEKQAADSALRTVFGNALKKAGIISSLAEDAAADRMIAAGLGSGDDIPGFISELKKTDPDSFDTPRPDPASLPKFSRSGQPDVSVRTDPLFENGIPLFSFRHPVR